MIRSALGLLVVTSIACGDAPDRSTPPPADSRDAAGRPEQTPPPTAAAPPTDPTPLPEGTDPGSHAVYVPAYSHIYHHVGDAFLLATTLSIRNTDPRESITVTSVRYYDTGGALVRRHLVEPRTLGPLASVEFVVEEPDVSGGSGANFIVEWRSEAPVSPPVIETVMISTRSGQGISFTSRGVTIERPEPEVP